MNNKVCIICKKDLGSKNVKEAKEISDDFVIRAIRKIKNTLKIASNNKLYICKEDLETHKKRRKSFEKSLVLSVVIALLVFFGLALLPVITSGTINLGSIALGLVIALLLILLCGFLKYVPAVKV